MKWWKSWHLGHKTTVDFCECLLIMKVLPANFFLVKSSQFLKKVQYYFLKNYFTITANNFYNKDFIQSFLAKAKGFNYQQCKLFLTLRGKRQARIFNKLTNSTLHRQMTFGSFILDHNLYWYIIIIIIYIPQYIKIIQLHSSVKDLILWFNFTKRND